MTEGRSFWDGFRHGFIVGHVVGLAALALFLVALLIVRNLP